MSCYGKDVRSFSKNKILEHLVKTEEGRSG